MPQIVAFGGGGLLDGGRQPAARRLRARADRQSSARKVCFVPTASGDADHYVVRFYRTFSAVGCEPSHVSLFRRDRARARRGRPRRRTCSSQDLIYVGGGSVSRCSASGARTARRVLREAWRRGVVLCGLSRRVAVLVQRGGHRVPRRADGGRGPRPAAALQLRPLRRRAARGARSTAPRSAATACAPGYAADDGAALHFAAPSCARVVSLAPRRARAYRVDAARRARSSASWRSLPRAALTVVAAGAARREPAARSSRWAAAASRREPDDPALDELVLEPRRAGRAADPASCRPPAATRSDADRPLPRRLRRPRRASRAHLSLFRLRGCDRAAARRIVLEQDVIYVGGGSMRNLLAIWQRPRARRDPARGVGARDRARRAERRRDVLVRGRHHEVVAARPSRRRASACCPASLSVHADGEPERRAGLPRRRSPRRAAAGWAADDGVGLLFRDGARARRVGAPGARAARVDLVDGGVVETPIEPELVAPGAARRAGRRARAARDALRLAARLTVERRHQRARAAAVAVLAQVDALPRAEREAPVARPAASATGRAARP